MGESAADLEALLRRVSAGGPAPGDLEALAERVEQDPATTAVRAAGLEPGGVAERLALLRRVADWAPAVEMEVAGHRVRACVSLSELWRYYVPICLGLAGLAAGRAGRVVAGITGPGAAGKSVFALLLRRLYNSLPNAPGRAAVCPMDGFHYPNAYLDSHTVVDAQGRAVPLRSVKGSPPSFDVEGFIALLRRLREGEAVDAPRYDRRIHDPVPGDIRIGAEDRLVLVEGNYLLLAEGRWAAVAGLLDVSIFLQQPMEAAREAMVERFVAGGRTEQDARAYYERVDRRNYEVITSTIDRADLVLERAADQHIASMRGRAARL
jgi:pantothenate kinase